MSYRELVPLPSDDAVVAAVRAEIADNEASMARARADGYAYFRQPMPTANAIAHRLGLNGARRAGNGAVKGTWSGYMSPALRIAPRLRALVRRGVLVASYDRESRGRWVYDVAGEEWWRRD